MKHYHDCNRQWLPREVKRALNARSRSSRSSGRTDNDHFVAGALDVYAIIATPAAT